MPKYNAAIVMLSSRSKLVEKCLTDLYKNWNQQYNYPVYIFYFNNIYSKRFIKKIRTNLNKNIFFIKASYEIPKNIKNEDLFYNKKNNDYVSKSFSKKRVGYLHMLRFKLNFLTSKISEIHPPISNYQYLMSIDDDSWIKKKIDYDLFDCAHDNILSTAYAYNTVNERILETRLGMWNFYYNYIKKNNITPKNKELNLAVQKNSEEIMHNIQWRGGNLDIYNMDYFKNNPDWEKFIEAFRKTNGDYKYRWGDGEIVTLFCYTFFDIIDLQLVEKGLYQHGFPSNFSSYAPFSKYTLNVNNFLIVRIYHSIKKFFIS